MQQEPTKSEKLFLREPACSDIKISGKDVMLSMCLPYLYIKIVVGDSSIEAIQDCIGDKEEIVDPDHPP